MQLIPPKGNIIIITLVTHFGKQKATNSIVAFHRVIYSINIISILFVLSVVNPKCIQNSIVVTSTSTSVWSYIFSPAFLIFCVIWINLLMQNSRVTTSIVTTLLFFYLISLATFSPIFLRYLRFSTSIAVTSAVVSPINVSPGNCSS